jgi:lactate permease
VPRPLPARLEAEDDLDVDLARPPRRRGRRAARRGPRRRVRPQLAAAGAPISARESDGGDGRAALPAQPAATASRPRPSRSHPRDVVVRAWMPWLDPDVLVFVWGLPVGEERAQRALRAVVPDRGLHQAIEKMPPVVPKATKEGAVYTFNLLSATGTGILLAALVGGLLMKYNPLQSRQGVRRDALEGALLAPDDRPDARARNADALLGLDTTLGLAFANTGVLYPFFGT